jgi:ABC-type lipoprotein release transport system permease subunit
MNFPFYIAKRYLVAKKSQNAINIISWISVISVGIGSFALVVVLSAFNGLEGLVESLFESFDSDIRIEAPEAKFFDANEIPFEELEAIPGVANYSRVLKEVCGARYGENQMVVKIKGVEASFLQMSELDSSIIQGEAKLIDKKGYHAILGYGVAVDLGVLLKKNPENITLFAPKSGKVNPINPMSSVYRKRINPAGVFYLSPEYDLQYMVVPLEFAQEFLEEEGRISSVEVQAEAGADLYELQESIERVLIDKFKVINRYQFNEIIYKTNRTEKWVTFLILLFILMIAAFNILSSLSMLIIEKQKDISTLSYLGATMPMIRRIFFFEGMMINLAGALGGMFLGIVICLLQEHVGLLRLEGGIVDYYPVDLRAIEMVYILITVLVIGFLTSWYPVRQLTRKVI